MITTLAGFLLVCSFCIYKFNPKTKSEVRNYTIVISLSLIAFSFFGSLHDMLLASSNSYNSNAFSYELGKWTRRIIIPLIVSIPFLYFFYKMKLTKENKVKEIVFIVGFFALILFGYGKNKEEKAKENQEDIMKYLENESAIDEIKASIKIMKDALPIENGDGFIVYDIILNENKKQVEYLYKNPINAVEELDYNDILDYKESWKEELIRISKNNPKNISFVNANISMIFKLEDKNGKPIFAITISPEDMK